MNLLNLNQQKAVEVVDKPLIINAGPGTGKTKTLIEKVKYLQEKEVDNILVLTFTEKAAREIQNRLKAEELKLRGFVGTFHALAYALLPNSNELKIIPDLLRKEIVESSLTELNSDLSTKDAELVITKVKNSLNDVSDYQELIDLYNGKLKKSGFIDFDDLLIRLLGILRLRHAQAQNDPSSSRLHRDYLSSVNLLKEDEGQAPLKFDYVLVDEFQDTNILQYQILTKLVKANKVCVIGDPLQSIYGFRGSDSSIFEQFKADFPDHQEIILDTNYRSGKAIIETSHTLFPNSPLLKSISESECKVKLLKTTNEFTEAAYIIREISKVVGGIDLIESSDYAHDSQEANFSNFAVIYRTHNLARILKQKFRECGIPYQVAGEGSIYDSSEFKLLFNCLSYIFTQNNNNLVEVFRSKYIDISEITINRIISSNNIDLLKRAKIAIEQKELTKISAKKLREIIDRIKILFEFAKTHKFSETAQNIFKAFEILEKIKSAELKTDLKNISNDLIRFNKFGQKAFIEYQKYIQDIEINEGYDAKADRVTLLTIHASKGLEFEYVFICGFEEGNIPLQRLVDEGNIEEEKRLLYVAMTRAKNYLYLINTKFRNNQKQLISKFSDDIFKSPYLKIDEDEFAKKYEVKKDKQRQKKSQFKMF